MDKKGLSYELDKALSNSSSKNSSSLAFFDTRSYPNSCRIEGGYDIGQSKVKFSGQLTCGEYAKKIEVKAPNSADLIKEIVQEIEILVSDWD